MWIDNNLQKPTKIGYYKCLVYFDSLRNLEEVENQLFDGKDWSHFESKKKSIRYWYMTFSKYEKTGFGQIVEEFEVLESKLNNIID